MRLDLVHTKLSETVTAATGSIFSGSVPGVARFCYYNRTPFAGAILKNNKNDVTMETTTDQKLEQITVLIQGESDWARFLFNTKAIDQLKSPEIDLKLVGTLMGKTLDGSKVLPLSEESNRLMLTLAAQYVPNLKSYEVMHQTGFKTLVITAFRVKDGKHNDYEIRVAGLLPNHVDYAMEVVNDTPIISTDLVVIRCLSESWPLYTGNYHPKSAAHDLIKQAKAIQGKFKIITMAPPNLQ